MAAQAQYIKPFVCFSFVHTHASKRSSWRLTTSMAKQQLSSGSVDKVTLCARALTRRLTVSQVLVSVFEHDASSDDGSEI